MHLIAADTFAVTACAVSARIYNAESVESYARRRLDELSDQLDVISNQEHKVRTPLVLPEVVLIDEWDNA